MWRVYAELSYKQIGAIFSKTENWACVTYHRARKMINDRSIDYLSDISTANGYTLSDRMALLFKGSASDWREAMGVLNDAHMVFEYSEEELRSTNISKEDISYYFGALPYTS